MDRSIVFGNQHNLGAGMSQSRLPRNFKAEFSWMTDATDLRKATAQFVDRLRSPIGTPIIDKDQFDLTGDQFG
jgi:hypothetical protein